MQIERLTRLAVDPFNQLDLATHLRVDDSIMIFEGARMANAAARELEEYASLALFNQSIRVTLDAWPRLCAWVKLPIIPRLPGSPLEVTIAGQTVTVFAETSGLRPAVMLLDPPEGEVIITYTAGFGTTLLSVPADLRHAILDQAAAFFAVRGETDRKHGTGMSPHMARIAARYRRVAV